MNVLIFSLELRAQLASSDVTEYQNKISKLKSLLAVAHKQFTEKTVHAIGILMMERLW